MEFGEAKDKEARTAEEGCELMAVSLAVVANMWADAAQESAERMWKEHVDKPAADPKLVERIARQTSLADGNDPDLRCYRYEIAHLGGIARHVKIIPEEVSIVAVWTLYAPLAEAAIIEMEAVLSERYPLPAATATTDFHNDPRYYPPFLMETGLREQDGPGELLPVDVYEGGARVSYTKDGFVIEFGEQSEEAVSSPKDAPLIEALRKQREKEGF